MNIILNLILIVCLLISSVISMSLYYSQYIENTKINLNANYTIIESSGKECIGVCSYPFNLTKLLIKTSLQNYILAKNINIELDAASLLSIEDCHILCDSWFVKIRKFADIDNDINSACFNFKDQSWYVCAFTTIN